MTVAGLIVELQKIENKNRQVIVQKDSEGNEYSPLDSIEIGGYCADSTWSGERTLEVLTPTLKNEGYSEDDVAEDQEPAVFLVPVN